MFTNSLLDVAPSPSNHPPTLACLLQRPERILVRVVIPHVDGHHVGLLAETQCLHQVGQRSAFVPVDLDGVREGGRVDDHLKGA